MLLVKKFRKNRYRNISVGLFYDLIYTVTWDQCCQIFLKFDRCDGVVVRASASQSVDKGFIPLVESYQKTLKNGIRSFPAWRSAFRGGCGKQAGKFACCVLAQGT